MYFDSIEWDEHNLAHACRRLTAAEIEQVIAHAAVWRRHRVHIDRVLFRSETNGGKTAIVIEQYDEIRQSVRPITAWEE